LTDRRGGVRGGRGAGPAIGNVIDLNRLSIGQPELRNDLPAGAARILQPATGYVATMADGAATRVQDRDTGMRPGRLARGAAGAHARRR
jgi:N-acyl-D-aspartate/D-glutamate deacylase